MADWEGGRIQTGIDKLMEYLQKEKEVNVEEAASSLDVDPETVLTWAKSLEKSGLAEVTYTARRGRLIRSVESDREGEAIDEAKDRVSSQLKQLSSLAEEKPRLERFEDVVRRMEKRLKKDEKAADKIHTQYEKMGSELQELEQYLEDVRELETDIDDLEDHIAQLKQDMTVLSTIDRDRLEAPEDSEPASSLASSKTAGIKTRVKRIMSRLPGFGGKDAAETFKCKQCGKTFDTRRGLRTHQGMVHREEDEGSTNTEHHAEQDVQDQEQEERGHDRGYEGDNS